VERRKTNQARKEPAAKTGRAKKNVCHEKKGGRGEGGVDGLTLDQGEADAYGIEHRHYTGRAEGRKEKNSVRRAASELKDHERKAERENGVGQNNHLAEEGPPHLGKKKTTRIEKRCG